MITIAVRGIPAPQGSKRFFKNGGMIEMSKAAGPWREAVRGETQKVMNGGAPLDGPVSVIADFIMPRPKSHYRTGRNAAQLRDSAPRVPSGKPDLDKLARALLDGLTAGGAWGDDGQVAQLITCKQYAGNGAMPGCTIEIRAMNGEA